jgi:phosphoenolpyruvate carboxylase
MQFSLRQGGDVRLADRKLKDLIRLVETFGFFCCALDVRQESTVHSEVYLKFFRRVF